jgi:hypothetical protein
MNWTGGGGYSLSVLMSKTKQLHAACYDLLATESRIAVFAAIAKNDIPQEIWFLMGRPHALDQGRDVLLSWTGTMFEYLMPALWMPIYPNTLLQSSLAAAVQSQQAYVVRATQLLLQEKPAAHPRPMRTGKTRAA